MISDKKQKEPQESIMVFTNRTEKYVHQYCPMKEKNKWIVLIHHCLHATSFYNFLLLPIKLRHYTVLLPYIGDKKYKFKTIGIKNKLNNAEKFLK